MTGSKSIINKISNFSGENILIEKGDGVIVGLSGGKDSVCLLHFLKLKARKMGLKLIACHINHNLRGTESDKDEIFCRELCRNWNIEFKSVSVGAKEYAKKRGISVEHSARNLRYKAFFDLAKKRKCKKIALGHHSDDNAETILLNLLRGTKVKGLLGIPVKRPLKEGAKYPLVVRPLMRLSRKEVSHYIAANKLKFRTDRSNTDEKYTRNWIRKTLLPLLERKQPLIKEHLTLISQDLARVLK